jgi:hypothetical protein
MNKKIRLLVVISFIFFVGIFVIEALDKRPFKFENFKSSEELKIFLVERYLTGSDGNIALENLALSGATCEVASKNNNMPNDLKKYDYIGWCNYSSSWFSWPPKEQYQIIILGDKDQKIIRFSVGKYSGFDI